MIIAIEGPELTDVNLKKFRTAEHANSIVSIFMTVHILISVFASLVSCIMFSVRVGFCGGKSQGSFVSNTASVSYRPKFGCYIESLS